MNYRKFGTAHVFDWGPITFYWGRWGVELAIGNKLLIDTASKRRRAAAEARA